MAIIIFRMMESMEEIVQAMVVIVMKRIMDISLVAEEAAEGMAALDCYCNYCNRQYCRCYE